jgi:glycosyltransferase involved in cell wall biosynthesis
VKIRVVEVLATLRRAGAERIAVSLACRLDRARFETSVISLFDAFPGGLEGELRECGVRVEHLGKHAGLDLRMYPRLWRAFRRLRPAIVHTHSYVLRYAWPAAVAARAGAVVHTVHNIAEREVSDPWGRAIQRAAFRRGAVPVAVAGEVARSFRKAYGFEPAATIPNGVEAARFRRVGQAVPPATGSPTACPTCPGEREGWRRAHGFGAGDLIVVSVARLEPQKNPLGLIDAFARMMTPGAHLVMAGEGSLADAARGRAARVHLVGVETDVAPLLAAADVFALASEWEGNPMAVMEAMAAGVPVVATAVGGVPEVVEHGVTGLLVPPGDPEALAQALDLVAADGALRRRMSAAAIARAQRFGVDAMVAAYADLFERVAGAAK